MSPNTTTLPLNIPENITTVMFSWYDYILFSFMLILSALIGVYFGCFGSKQSTADEYLMGNKKMRIFPISMSLVASHVSGIILLAVPADIYLHGATFWLICPSIVLATVGVIYIYLPVFYKLQLTSTYEYLERRFDSKNRIFASFLFTLSMLLYLPLVIYIPGLAFSAVTGVNVHLITPIVCGVCIFYTTLGGLKAVVWTDTLQFTVTTGAIITVFCLGLRSAGGFNTVWEAARTGDRLNIFDFDPDPTKRDSLWIMFISSITYWFAMTGINQTCVQKFLSLPSLAAAKLSAVYFTIGMIVVTTFSVTSGLIIYAKYSQCDPFTTGQITRNDQLLPYYIMDVASAIPGLSGLFIAGIFCAALSTLSASLNCVSGTIYEDFISKIYRPNDRNVSYLLKLIVMIVGTICTILVFVFEHLGGILPLSISFNGLTSGPLLAMFTIGIFFPRASSKGTFYGAIISLVFTGWIVFTAQYYKAQGFISYQSKPTSVDGCGNSTFTTNFSNDTTSIVADEFVPFVLFRISFFYYATFGFCLAMISGLLISYLTTNEDPPVHRDLLTPVIYFLLSKERQTTKLEANYSPVRQVAEIRIN